jgi:hypothetical protein
MAVLGVVTSTVKPDRYEDFIDLNRKVKMVVERAGVKNVKLRAGLIAGQATGSFVFTIEADDFAAYGAAIDKYLADPEGQLVQSLLGTSASPIAELQYPLWVDVPL